MIYFQLFLAFLQIGAFSFGGGYAAMPLIQAQVIEKYHWPLIPTIIATSLALLASCGPDQGRDISEFRNASTGHIFC